MKVSHIFKELSGQTMTPENAQELLENMLMEVVECMGCFPVETKNIDCRVWQHLLVYASKPTPVAWQLTMNDKFQVYLDKFKTELEYIADGEQSTDFVIEPLYKLSDDYMSDTERRKALLVKANILTEDGNYHPDFFSEETIAKNRKHRDAVGYYQTEIFEDEE